LRVGLHLDDAGATHSEAGESGSLRYDPRDDVAELVPRDVGHASQATRLVVRADDLERDGVLVALVRSGVAGLGGQRERLNDGLAVDVEVRRGAVGAPLGVAGLAAGRRVVAGVVDRDANLWPSWSVYALRPAT